MIDRGEYWQCGYVVRRGSYDDIKKAGINAFRHDLAAASSLPLERFVGIQSWSDVHALNIQIDRLKKWWRPGLICIGDAAHAMSPIGGVGVNLAIQDAVAAANILIPPLKHGSVTSAHLAAIETRRRFPTKATQTLQLWMRRGRRANGTKPVRLSAAMRWIMRCAPLQHVAGRLIGLGFRPEYVCRA